VYLDTNVFFDVFEMRDPALFPQLGSLCESGEIRVIASEINLVEMLAGNDLPQFAASIERLFSVSPAWLYLSGLTMREVVWAFDRPRRARSLLPVASLYEWDELLPLIATEEARKALPDLAIPTAEAIATVFPASVIKEREAYWEGELEQIRTGVRDEMVYIRTVQNFFRKTVASSLRVNLGDSRDLADRLWDDPDRAPAFRLELELGVHTLNTATPRWSRNDFMDHIHAGALGYVDFFVTRDGLGKKRGLIQKIDWYDTEVRLPRGRAPYGVKLCRGWDDFERKLRHDSGH
jgi:hypothetical protein